MWEETGQLLPQVRRDLPADFEYRECVGTLLWTKPKTAAGTGLCPSWSPYG